MTYFNLLLFIFLLVESKYVYECMTWHH